jgi:hypothetical protein
MEKIVTQKSFNNLVGTPLSSGVHIQIHVSLQVHFNVSAVWYSSHYFWQICHLVNDTGGNLLPVSTTPAVPVEKFAIGVVDSSGKFATSVVYTGGAPSLANISTNFWKNLKWPQCYYRGLGGRWFMKKTWSKKSRDTVPLN